MRKKISAILPAFDESPRMEPVLSCAVDSGLFSDVVVVDDGSRDDTLSVAREFPVITARHERNMGKGSALQSGLNLVGDSDVVVFLDADLIGLTAEHLESLVKSVIDRPSLGMAVARFIEGRRTVDLQQRWFAILNGQRALSRAFLQRLPDLSWTRFGVEVLMTWLARDMQVPVRTVLWRGVTHYTKEEKFGPLMGFYARLKMYKEVLATCLTYPRRVASHLGEMGTWDHEVDLEVVN